MTVETFTVDRAWLRYIEWASSYGVNGERYCPRCNAWLRAFGCCPGESHHDGCDLAAALGLPTHREHPAAGVIYPGTLAPLR